jgi:hypothetical protein
LIASATDADHFKSISCSYSLGHRFVVPRFLWPIAPEAIAQLDAQ